MGLEFFCEEIEFKIENSKNIKRWISNIITSKGKLEGEVSIIFCNDDYILNINREYLKHDYFTDIITFDYSEQNIISGDLFISLDTVNYNADKLGVPRGTELLRVIIHGIFHLLGYNDKCDEEEKEMRNLEDEALKMIFNGV